MNKHLLTSQASDKWVAVMNSRIMKYIILVVNIR